MNNLDRCSWKLVSPDKFILGQVADRCGDIADVVVLRPNRKTDLFLCENHLNDFINKWGLHNEVVILCRCEEEDSVPAGTFGNPEFRMLWKPCLEGCLHPECIKYWGENE